MADTGRRRVGASAAGASPAGVRSPPRYLPPQQTPQPQRYARPDSGRAGGGMNMRGPNGAPKTPPVNSKMGIKSGMTVEDLKRLTQQRIQQTSGQDPLTQRPATPTTATPATSGASGSTPATPTLNMAAVHAGNSGSATNIPTPTPLVPKAGMSVQELKQLTSLRLASQNVPLHQSEITGLVSKAVLSNAAKSHYRESLRGSLTPSTTPKRTMGGGSTTPGRSSIGGGSGAHNVPSQPAYDHMAERHSLPSRPLGIPSMRGNDNDLRNRSSDFSFNQMRYSYSGPDDFGSDSSQETDYTRPSLDLDDEGGRYAFDDQFNSFTEDSFPPPPPLDDNGGFVSTSLPSWSPPPARSKKLDAASQPVSFYSQQTSYFNQQQAREDTSRDQNAVIAPPPGLTRRPSMTVPWQVAEAVLNTPQTTTGRKTVMSPTSSGDGRPEPVTSNMFARRNEGPGLNRPAAEVAAELSALALTRQRSGAPPPAPSTNTAVAAPLGTSPPGGSSGARRGSFGNAAEFFKFRRRSKSRLELARDIASMSAGEGGGFPNYGATGGSLAGSSGMPGIDESRDLQDSFSLLGHGDSSSVASNDDSPVYTPGDEDFEGSEGGGSFVSFYNATSASRNRGEGGPSGLSSLSIPPPPPPPLTDDEDDASTTSSSKGLPMMSPNGFRLRKVAELARRGSLSSEDKTRVKDEIIQSSLGIGASNAARILTAKPTGSAAPTPGERPPVSVTTTAPPPGFQRLSSTPPRDTPKATATKTLAAGIVRNTTTGIAARSPPKPSTMMSPTSGRKAFSPTAGADSRTLEERLASAAQRVADCAGKGDMVGFQEAMEELDGLRNEANARMRG